jgi:hypothetical protein
MKAALDCNAGRTEATQASARSKPKGRRFPRMRLSPAIQFVQMPDGKIVALATRDRASRSDRTDQGAQRRRPVVRMRAAHGVSLTHRVPGRTQHLHAKSGIGKSHRQTGRGHPIRRRYKAVGLASRVGFGRAIRGRRVRRAWRATYWRPPACAPLSVRRSRH